ncbi:MAG: rRNA maturation RNase YbeY [bacterium]|nr:rRNA maturation RNase YbeY [bacterium]
MENIHFFEEDISFQLEEPNIIINWVQQIINQHQQSLEEINYIFCSDSYLLNINQEYLNHDTFTDIVTFNNSEESNKIESDIFISIDRIKENANSYNKSFEHELYRVMIHGVLHLLGFDDKTEEEKSVMREKEEACLSLLNIK